jgi:hypothetical protein
LFLIHQTTGEAYAVVVIGVDDEFGGVAVAIQA